MRPLTEQRLRRIRTVLLDEVRAFAPDWTDQNESDPGVTLLQLFAFLTEGLSSGRRAVADLTAGQRRGRDVLLTARLAVSAEQVLLAAPSMRR